MQCTTETASPLQRRGGACGTCSGVAEERMGRGRAMKKRPGNRSTTKQGDSDESSIKHGVQGAPHHLPVLRIG